MSRHTRSTANLPDSQGPLFDVFTAIEEQATRDAISAGNAVSSDNAVSTGDAISANDAVPARDAISAGNAVSTGDAISANDAVVFARDAISAGNTISSDNAISTGDAVSANNAVSANDAVSTGDAVSANEELLTVSSEIPVPSAPVTHNGTVVPDETVSIISDHFHDTAEVIHVTEPISTTMPDTSSISASHTEEGGKPFGLKASQALKKPTDWLTWRSAMRRLFVLHGVYDAVKNLFDKEKEDTKNDTKTASFSARSFSKTSSIDWDKLDDPKTLKLIKAMALIEASVAIDVRTVIQGMEEPLSAWEALENWAIGSGPVHRTNLLNRLNTIRTDQFKSIQDYITEFQTIRRSLIELGRQVGEDEYTNAFVTGAADQYRNWAIDMRRTMRLATPTLEAVIHDLRDEAALHTSKKASEFNNYADNRRGNGRRRHSNNGRSSGPKKSSNNNAKRGLTQPKFKPGECPHKNHSKEDCWADHPEKRPDWMVKEEKSSSGKAQGYKKEPSNEANLVEYSFSAEMDSLSGASLPWLADTGSSCHIAVHPLEFESLDRTAEALPPIRTGGGIVTPEGVGTVKKVVRAGDEWRILTLNRVYYCPKFAKNILSLQRLYHSGGHIHGLDLISSDGSLITTLNNDFTLEIDDSQEVCYSTEVKDIDLALWHSRLGHIGNEAIRRTAAATKGIVSDCSVSTDDLICVPCELGRSLRYTPQRGRPIPDRAGEEWHLDSVQVSYPGGQDEFYAIVFTEGKYGFKKAVTLEFKEDGPVAIHNTLKKAKRQWKVPIKRLQMDGGFELIGRHLGQLESFLKDEGIEVITSAPYTPEQNGVAERANRQLLEIARVWMIASEADPRLWPYFFETAVDYSNFVVNNKTRAINKTPYEAFFDENDPGKPHTVDLANLRTPGCRVFVNIPFQRRMKGDKFAPIAEEGILLGWKGRTNYVAFIPGRPGRFDQRIINTTSLTFHEVAGTREVASAIQNSETPEEEAIADSITVKPRVIRSLPPNAHPRRRIQLEALISECCYNVIEAIDAEPLTVAQALARADAKFWKQGLFNEFRNMLKKGVFRAVDQSKAKKKALTARHVFKRKPDSDGNIEKYKVRLVARGFEQREGIDYDETFAAVAKANTWRILLALAAMLGWDVQQLDVVAAFLNGDLEEEVFIEIPDGMALFFEEHPEENTIGFDACKDQVLLVLRSLYGLKQAPRQWQKALKRVLLSLGFIQLKSDNAVFINYKQRLVLCTYVDDMLILGPNSDQIRQFKSEFAKQFEIKDLGDANYFLGVRIVRNRPEGTIILMQDAFAQRILEAKGRQNLKPAKTPLAQGSLVHAVPREDTASPDERFKYQSITGSELYLMSQTRPDLAFTLSILSRFCHNPSQGNFLLCDHSLRYLSGTTTYGLVLGGANICPEPEWDNDNFTIAGSASKSKHLPVNIWTDSDWKGDKVTGKSTHSYVVQLGHKNNIVSWRSKRTSRVMLSSTEAEYYALGKGAQAALWFRGLLTELRIPAVFTLKGDNQGSIKLARNPEFHQRTGHIPLEEHFLRDEIEAGRIAVEWVPTEEQLADGLTKLLPPASHKEMVRRLGLVDIPAQGVRFHHPV